MRGSEGLGSEEQSRLELPLVSAEPAARRKRLCWVAGPKTHQSINNIPGSCYTALPAPVTGRRGSQQDWERK